jgi:outer membrane lipoprotein-sorting protein
MDVKAVRLILSLFLKWDTIERMVRFTVSTRLKIHFPKPRQAPQEGKMKASRMIICIFILLISLPAAAQNEAKTKQIVDDLTEKAKAVKSYRVDTEMETHAMGEQIRTRGSMAFKEPNKMHITTTTDLMGGMQQETYKADSTIWTYMPQMKMASKVEMDKVKEAMPSQKEFGEADLSKTLKDMPAGALTFIEEKNVDGNDVYVFQMSPEAFTQDMASPQKTFPMMPQKIEFMVFADNGLPYQFLLYGKNNELIMSQKYTNYQINTPIPDSEFEFTPPEGAQVVDMTDATISMMKQMQQGSRPAPQAEQAQPAPAPKK